MKTNRDLLSKITTDISKGKKGKCASPTQVDETFWLDRSVGKGHGGVGVGRVAMPS